MKTITIFFKHFCWLLFIAGSATCFAQTPQYSNGMGAGANASPLNSSPSNKAQFIYIPSVDFPTAPRGYIKRLYFCAGSDNVRPVWTNLLVRIGYTNLNAWGHYSTEPWVNEGLETYLNAPTYTLPIVTVRGNWFYIDLEKPFFYNASQNFIVEMSQTGANPGTAGAGGGNDMRKLQGSSTSPTGSSQNNLFYMGFDITPLSQYQNNASIDAFINPNPNGFCAGSHDVKVRLKNTGGNIINNVTINWELDGTSQAPILWNHPLDTPDGAGITDTVVTLTNLNFTFPTHTIKAWTSMPNGVIDTVNTDDTILVRVKPSLNGTYHIGPFSQYTSFSDAINDLNDFGTCGPVTFNIDPGNIFNEPPLILTRTGTSSAPIIFQKTYVGATNPIIYGINGTGTTDAIITLKGVEHITFDGIDVIDSSGNTTSTTQMEYGYAIINAKPDQGTSSNTIKNCKITLNKVNTNTIGLLQSASTTGGGVAATTLEGGNHNNRYENIKIENTYNGILLQGTPAFPDSNNVITSSGTDTTILEDIGNGSNVVYGIQLTNQKDIEVSNSIIRNISTSNTVINGLYLNNTATNSNYGNAVIKNNRIYNISTSSTSTTASGGVHGIRIDVSPNATASVYNNMIYGLSKANLTSANANIFLRGISHGVSGNGSANYYHNSISIINTSLNVSSTAFWKGGSGNITYKNNIFSNTTASQNGNAKHYAVYIGTTTGIINASHNILWAPNNNGFLGYSGGDRATLSAFALAITPSAPADGNERGSVNADPNFNSTTDLNFSNATPAAASAVQITNPNINTDIIGTPRNMYTRPTIGAYETYQLQIDSAAPVIENIRINSNINGYVYADISDNSGAVNEVILWYRSGTSGPFTSTLPDSIPSGNGTYKWSSFLSLLPNGICQFYIVAADISFPERKIAVNPFYSGSFSGFGTTSPINFVTNPDAATNTYTFLKGGTYTVGATGQYAKLVDVASTLNSTPLAGDVIFELQSDYDGSVGETFPITFTPFNALNPETKVTIRPAAGVTARITEGTPSANTPLIILDRINKIIFDGRPGGTGSTIEWTIRNKATASVSSNFRFINGASYNTLQYLKVESQNTTTSSTNAGIISFRTAVAGTDGNSYNTISNCEIRDRSDATGTPAIGIYSNGTNNYPNRHNLIEDNKIINWTNGGIQVTSGSGDSWTISNNSFYMTTTATTAQTAISFQPGTSSTSGRNIISGNYIGGSAPNAGGIAWENISTNSTTWYGIICNGSQTDSNYLYNNTIQNIKLVNNTSGSLTGIYTGGGIWNIYDNTIGHASTANSIEVSSGSTTAISLSNTANNYTRVYNNFIANIKHTGMGNYLTGIDIQSISSINPIVVSNNIIHTLSADNNMTLATTPSVSGILYRYNGTEATIANNTIYNLAATGGTTNAATTAFGINISAASSTGTIAANHIYGINNTSRNPTAQIAGIHINQSSSWDIINNMIALGHNVDSSATIMGIKEQSVVTANNKVYHNSILISGNATNDITLGSYAYLKATASGTNLRNNIFSNTRTGYGNHYAVASVFSTPGTGWQANYNVLYATDSNKVGLWGDSSYNLTQWKDSSAFDTNSVNIAVDFVSNTDLHLTGSSIGNHQLAGSPIDNITTDFDGETRDLYKPYIGADENISNPLPVQLLSLKANIVKDDVLLTWSTASEVNASHFVVERLVSGNQWSVIGKVKTKGNSTSINNYQFTDQSPFTNHQSIYYRLLIVDNNGSYEYSKVVSVSREQQATQALSVYPNPFNKNVNVEFLSTVDGTAHFNIVDITGRDVQLNVSQRIAKGSNILTLDTDKLNSGVYFLSVELNGEKQVMKLIKQ